MTDNLKRYRLIRDHIMSDSVNQLAPGIIVPRGTMATYDPREQQVVTEPFASTSARSGWYVGTDRVGPIVPSYLDIASDFEQFDPGQPIRLITNRPRSVYIDALIQGVTYPAGTSYKDSQGWVSKRGLFTTSLITYASGIPTVRFPIVLVGVDWDRAAANGLSDGGWESSLFVRIETEASLPPSAYAARAPYTGLFDLEQKKTLNDYL